MGLFKKSGKKTRILALCMAAVMAAPGWCSSAVYAGQTSADGSGDKTAASEAAGESHEKLWDSIMDILDTGESPGDREIAEELEAQEAAENQGGFDSEEDLKLADNSENITDRLPDIEETSVAFTLPEEGEYVEGELLIKKKGGARLASVEEADSYIASSRLLFSVEAEAAGSDSESSLAGAGDAEDDEWYLVTLKKGADITEAANALLRSDDILNVEANRIITLNDPDMEDGELASMPEPSGEDPYMVSQNWLDMINAPEAWDLVSNPGLKADGSPVVTAVIDTGVDLDHPDLIDRLVPGYDFVSDDDVPDDEYGHGTHVAGIIAASRNDQGVRGVAYASQIMPVRVMDANGSGTTDIICKGIIYAAEHGADVLNLSIGGFGKSAAQSDAYKKAYSLGSYVVISAGNESYPTCYAGSPYYGVKYAGQDVLQVMIVMAMYDESTHKEDGDWLALFSNYDADPYEGTEYEIMAPGYRVISTYMDGGYGSMSGTSMAAPVVAGAAAVLKGMGCDNSEIRSILLDSGDVLKGKTAPGGDVFNYPAINLEEAVTMKLESTLSLAPAADIGSISANLDNITVHDVTVNLANLNTYNPVYYKGGRCLSEFSVDFGNYGGTGDFTITGKVGGCEIESRSITLPAGETTSAAFKVKGTPSISDSYVNAEITITPSGGNPVHAFADFMAFDLSVPDSLQYIDNGSVQGYTMTADTATITSDYSAGFQVILLEHSLAVNYTQNLTIDNCIIYAGNNNGIAVGYKDLDKSYAKRGILNITNSIALGEKNFAVAGYGQINLKSSRLYDPAIQWASSVLYSTFSLLANSSSDLYGFNINYSSFKKMSKLSVECAYLQHSLINGCYNSTIKVDTIAQANTFVDNYYPFDNKPESTIKVVVPDYQPSGQQQYDIYNSSVSILDLANAGVRGLRYSSIVGPANILSSSGNSEVPAKIYGIYHQDSQDPAVNYNDYFICSADSEVSGDTAQLADWGFASSSPVFVTGFKGVKGNSVQEQGRLVNMELLFSTAVSSDSAISSFGWLHDFYNIAEFEYNDDYTSCSAVCCGYSNYISFKQLDFRLSGIYTKSASDTLFKNTALGYQTFYTDFTVPAPEPQPSKNLEQFNVELTDEGAILLTWKDNRTSASSIVTITKVGSTMSEINATNGAITTSGAFIPYNDPAYKADDPNVSYGGMYLDSDVEPGMRYTYYIEVPVNGELTLSGLSYYLIATEPSNAAKACVNPDGSTDVYLKASQKTSLITITVPSIAAKSVEVTPTLNTYGIKRNDDETTTIFINSVSQGITEYGDDSYLFELIPEDGVSAAGISMSTVVYVTKDRKQASIVNFAESDSAFCILSAYDENGKALKNVTNQGRINTINADNSCKIKLFQLDPDTYKPLKEPLEWI